MKNAAILLADDDNDDRNLFKRAIEEIDSSVSLMMVENGQELLAFLSSHKGDEPDVIFLDVNMPVMDGWECLKELKENDSYKNVSVIIYSTTSQRHHVKKALQLGALCLITKPDSFKRIKEILSVVVSNIKSDPLEGLKPFQEVKWQL